MTRCFGARLLLALVLSVSTLLLSAAVDPDDGGKEQCPGGPEGVKNGDVTSNVKEAKGVDGVERCYPGPQSSRFIQDIEYRCETRHCCQEPCNCTETHVQGQSEPCPSGTTISSLRCLVQHLHPTPRFFTWKCCDGFVEHPENQQCLITCDKDNGDCHQQCTPAVDPPHPAVCSCFPGHTPHDDDPDICVDHDECLTLNGGCSDLCNNTVGSYTCLCEQGRQFMPDSKLKCQDIPVVLPPVVQPATQETGNSSTTFIVVGIVGGLILLAILVVLLIFLCRKKKRPEGEPHDAPAYTNATYGDLDGRGAAASGDVYGDTEDVKKVPIDGAVGFTNPTYEEEKKALEAAAVAVPNHYEEIPCGKEGATRAVDNPSYTPDRYDGYENPISVRGSVLAGDDVKRMSLPGEVEEEEFSKGVPMFHDHAVGARPKQTGVLPPPEYSEIPTPGEVQADPRPPTYNSIGRQPVRFKDFQDVKFDNVNNEILDHHVDIKDIDVKSKTNK